MIVDLPAALRRFAAEPPEVAAAAIRRFKTELVTGPGAPADRVAEVLSALRADHALRDAFAARLGALLARLRHRFLYADTGVLGPLSFGRTLRARLGAKLLPHVADPGLRSPLRAL
jgi:site-specific recombinase